jgi:hypothetical protein
LDNGVHVVPLFVLAEPAANVLCQVRASDALAQIGEDRFFVFAGITMNTIQSSVMIVHLIEADCFGRSFGTRMWVILHEFIVLIAAPR